MTGARRLRLSRGAARGFTLIELIVAITIIAIASAAVAISMGRSGDSDLEREALHLASVLETARAEARAASLDVRWMPDGKDGGSYRFTGLPPDLIDRLQLNRSWLGEPPVVDIQGATANGRSVRLGPEPLIGAQRILLTRGDHRMTVSTDGLGPFRVQRGSATP
ncbi:prepilin-type N-terminal cleavage/methylation domain-containing protein [Roseateles amylovorans]|jgi:general secretion pathway protein H|uniref:Prepilin-type N-terminal cleavage/methylation domain-containing protein n=1 Tax=Roseateles amylovorans TaxID=2978473 RepID=A0ABY6B3A5_9BURK|nr:prepilin-type N-terminal cleavage/methylation domain-containing protein [Roseateles amylovorans]UXH79321.1 prepilin-type N-terminal cleavage/methylation domain-containing protein [Roseateles amylovorans]